MTKTNSFRRFLCSCFSPSTTTKTIIATAATPTTKKRLSTSLRDDLPDPTTNTNQDSPTESLPSSFEDGGATAAPPRSSKAMVIGTIFGNRRGHVWLCMQHDRLSTKPFLLLELSIPTTLLVKEMQCGVVRITLEPSDSRSNHGPTPLRSVLVWTMYCNGKKLGFAMRRKANEQNRLMLKTMQSMTVGAGVIPAGAGSSSGSVSEEIMYMRANYEHVVGSADSESFHLISPDASNGQELSVFLMRTK